MADSVDVPIKLPTDASGVQAGTAAVKGLEDALKRLGPAAAAGSKQATGAIKGLGGAASSKKQTVEGGVDFSRSMFKSRKGELKDLEKNIGEVGGGGMAAFATKAGAALAVVGAIVAVVGKVGSVALDTAAKVGEIALQFYKALVSVAAFRESTLGAFAKILGGTKAAQDAFRETVKLSGKIGIGVKEALSGVNSLIAKGFKADEARDLVKAMADLKSVVPDANIGNLLLAITQIKSKGVLQMEELQGQIAEAGLSVSVVLEEIGKKIGKSAADVRKMIAAGKISADEGVQGILAAIQRTTGKPLGEAAAEAANSLGGLISRVQDLPNALLLAADSSKGMGVLKDVLQNILSVMSPGSATGDAFAAAIGRLGNALSTLLGGLTGGPGKNALESFANGVTGAINKVAEYIETRGPELGKRLANILSHVDEIFTVIGAFVRPITQVIDLFIAATNAVDRFVRAVNGIPEPKSLDDVLSGPLKGAGATAGPVAQQAGASIGSMLVAGLVGGIAGGIPGAVAAVLGLTEATTNAAQQGYQVHSPSRVFDDLGYQLPAGQAQGTDRGAPLAVSAVERMTADTIAAPMSFAGRAPTAKAALGGGPTATTAGTSKSIVFEAGAVVVTVAPTKGMDEVALSRMVAAEIRLTLAEIANA